MRLRNATAASPWRRSVFDSPEELLRSIRLGEDSALELKDVRFRGARSLRRRKTDATIVGARSDDERT